MRANRFLLPAALISIVAGLAACSSSSNPGPSESPTPGRDPVKQYSGPSPTSPSPAKPPAAQTPVTQPSVAPVPPTADAALGKIVDNATAQEIIGTYAVRSTVAQIQDAPVIGKMDATSVAYGLTEIKRDGQGLVSVERGCHVDLVTSGPVKPVVPDAVASSIPVTTYPFRAWTDNGAMKFARDEVALAVGAHLANAETDALPTTDKDPRVWDQDGDGKPGITVKITGLLNAEIYVVQRQRQTYAGDIGANGVLTGLVHDASEQSIIGASSDLLKQNVPTSPNPDPTKSAVVMTKVARSYECAALVKEAATLFPAL